jgi:hypothetical protein
LVPLVEGGAAAAKKQQGAYKEITLSDAAVVMAYAEKVMIVPGYGLAVAQAQHACHDLEKLLTDRGVDVKYAIHPVRWSNARSHERITRRRPMLVTTNWKKWNKPTKNFHRLTLYLSLEPMTW